MVNEEPAAPGPPASAFAGELLVWLSPNFPVGGFAYSQGLEAAVEKGWVGDAASLADWLGAVAREGALHNDLIIISLVMRATRQADITELVELAAALQPSAERAAEARDQGRNFMAAYAAAWAKRGADPALPVSADVTLPVALALAARDRNIPVPATLEAYAIAFSNNLVSAAVRIGIVGQFAGQRLLAELLPDLREIAAGVVGATRDDLGSATFRADLASIYHETQTTRLFRS